MKIEEICEYLNDIGILQIENINNFLNIYSQLSHIKYKNKYDQIILALFSYLTSVSKKEKYLYEICKNIVHNFSNNQILYRYRALSMISNIFKTKFLSRYILFIYKLISYIYNKKIKNRYITFNPNSKISNSNYENDIQKYDEFDNEYEKKINNTSINKIKNNINKPRQKSKIIKKVIKNKDKNIYNISDNEKEYTFSPEITRGNKPNINSRKDINNFNIKNKSLKNMNMNYHSVPYSSYNDNLENINYNLSNKIISFKNSVNYGLNNKINNEIEKMIGNISKNNNNQIGSKFLSKKTQYSRQRNNFIPSNTYQNYDFQANNNYNFYKNEKDHMKKVEDKIYQLKVKQIDKMSKECTFTPEINKNSRYLNLIKNNQNDEDNDNYIINNFTQRNNIDTNNNNNYNYNNKSTDYITDIKKNVSKDKNSKINKEYANDFYNIYPIKLTSNYNNINTSKKQRSHSFSNSKKKNEDNNNNEYSIYKTRKEELSKLFKEQCPFMPSIKYNKKFPVKSSFDERQKNFIKNKERLNKLKEEQEIEQIEKFQRMNNRAKTNSREVVKRLYDKEAIKIKDRIKREIEEKSRKKNVIDWDKRKKKYKEKYPDDFNSVMIRNKKMNFTQENSIKKDKTIDNNCEEFCTFNNEKNNENHKNIKIKNQDIVNKNKQILMDKIKNEHVIGFKNNNYNNVNNNSNINDYFNNINIEDNENKNNKNFEEEINNENNMGSFRNSNNLENRMSNEGEELFDMEERMKKFENGNLLENLNNKEGIKSSAFQNMINKINNK